jgi:hypothetical protein
MHRVPGFVLLVLDFTVSKWISPGLYCALDVLSFRYSDTISNRLCGLNEGLLFLRAFRI